jgi:hypothetical protein
VGLRGIDMQRTPRTATADFHRRLTAISRSATMSPFFTTERCVIAKKVCDGQPARQLPTYR